MLFLKEVLTWVYLGGKVAQTFAPLTRISHDRIRHIWHPRKSIDQEKVRFSQSFQLITVAAAAPRSLRQGQVFKACWNLKVHPTPFMTLSFLSKVTESTFSMLDTKYSSWSLNTSSRKLASRHWEIKAWMYTSKFSWNCAVSAYERFRISLKKQNSKILYKVFRRIFSDFLRIRSFLLVRRCTLNDFDYSRIAFTGDKFDSYRKVSLPIRSNVTGK